MKDKNTGFYKIGVSSNPSYREKTLQSEKPTIVLLSKKMFETKSYCYMCETHLHAFFGKVRIRGEWFNLTSNDLDNILEFFCSDRVDFTYDGDRTHLFTRKIIQKSIPDSIKGLVKKVKPKEIIGLEDLKVVKNKSMRVLSALKCKGVNIDTSQTAQRHVKIINEINVQLQELKI